MGFCEFVESLPPERQREACSSNVASRRVQAEFLKANPSARRARRQLGVRRRRLGETIRHQLMVGRQFAAWRATPEGKASKAFLSDFCKTLRPYASKVPQAKEQALHRAIKLAKLSRDTGLDFGLGGLRKAMATNAESRTPAPFLKRRRQAPRSQCWGGPLGEVLWDWFVDMRASIHGILPWLTNLLRKCCVAKRSS